MADREELEALRRLARSQSVVTTPQGGQGGGPTPSPQMQPDASGQVVPYQTGALGNTLAQMGEEAGPLGKLGLGLAQSGARTARALGIPQALRALGVDLDPQGDEALDEVAKGTGWQGTVGDLAGTTVQALGGGAAGAKMLPAAYSKLAAAYPRIAAYLGGAGGAAATTAVMTPGGLEERGTEAAKSAALSLPLTAALRTIAKPVQMSVAGQNLKAATGEMPPLHVGAESKLIRDLGDVMTDIPGLGAPLVAGEKRVMSAGMRQLWGQATPPGQPNLLTKGGKIERGPLFEELKAQFDSTYTTLLKGHRIPTTSADRQRITKIIDRSLVPEDAAQLHKIMDKYFPKGNYMGGRTWKELQEVVRSEAASFSGSQGAVEKRMGAVLDEIDEHLIKMRNRGVPRDVAQKLDATDGAYSVRKLLEKAVGGAKGFEGLDPAKLASALSARTSEAALARGHGTGQTLVDSMAAALVNLNPRNTGQALWGLRRLIAPTVASGIALGTPGAALPAATLGAMNFAGAGPRGAKAMFGEYELQRKLADLMREYPSAIPALSAGLEVQGQE